MALVLTGTVVTFDSAESVYDPGVVYLGDDGMVSAVGPIGIARPTGFNGAPQIDTGAVIYPGLVDLHNHIGYNTLPLWEASHVPYQHHNSWTRETADPTYADAVSCPSKVMQRAAAEALIKYVEVKALIGGTTSIQGAPHTTRPVDGWLVRIVDIERFGGPDRIEPSALQKPIKALQAEAAKLQDGHVFIYHMAEGIAGSVVHQEFVDVQTAECDAPGLVGVHSMALTAEDFAAWQATVARDEANQRGTVAWSPFSNLWLYHKTTDVVTAAGAGLRIALGSDWSPSGTKHVLAELKVADLLNNDFRPAFTDAQLCQMVTANPGDALARAWGGNRIGRVEADTAADVIVVERHQPDLHRNLIQATERDIQLVAVRGKPFYGTPALMAAAGAASSDAIMVAGQPRALVVRQPGSKDAQFDWPGFTAALEAVRKDPVGVWRDAQHALAAWGGPLDDPDAPLVLFGDMPEGDVGLLAASDEVPTDLVIPPLDSLTHDAAFFSAITRTNPPGLSALAGYYQ